MKKRIIISVYSFALLFFCLAEDFIPVEYRIEKDIIFDTLDFPIKYVFYLDKATGKISELSLVR